MKKIRKRAALIAAIVLLLQSTVGVYIGMPAYAANDTEASDDAQSGDDEAGAAKEESDASDSKDGEDKSKADKSDADSGDKKDDDKKDDDKKDDDKKDEGSQEAGDTETTGSDNDADKDGEDAGDATPEESAEPTAGPAPMLEFTYNEGDELYILKLQKGDLLDKGVGIHPFVDALYRLKYLKELMKDGVINIRDHEVQKFHVRYIYVYLLESGKRNQVNEDIKTAYYTDQPMKVTKISKDYSGESVSVFVEPYTGEEREVTQTNRGDVVSGDDLEMGDVIAAKSTVAVGGGIYKSMSVYLDGNEEPVNEDPTEYKFPTKARVLSAEPDPSSPKNLILTCETFYGNGEVGSEEALRAALTQDDAIKLASDIELTEQLMINDGKQHTIELNGYVLSRQTAEENVENGGVIHVSEGSELVLKDSSEDQAGVITGGHSKCGGAIVVENATIRMNGGTITENYASCAGAIDVEKGTLELKNVVICNNEAQYNGYTRGEGGAVRVDGSSTCTMENCELLNNKAQFGGGVSNEGTAELTDCTIEGNFAEYGGGIYTVQGEMKLTNCDIRSNNSSSKGGGIDSTCQLTIADCVIDGNGTEGRGGGIYSLGRGDEMKFKGENTISNNTAGDMGGGIFDDASPSLELSHMTISGNVSTKEGGGLHALTTKKLTLNDVTIVNNTGAYGGGMRANNDVNVTDCAISDNFSNGDGGGIYYGILGGDHRLTVTNTTITNNICTYNGGGIWMAQDGTSTGLTLGGGKTVITGNVRNRDGTSKENNIMFYKLREIRITGKFEKDSLIGVDHWMNFDRKTITKGYGDNNNEPIDTFFVSDHQDYEVLRDDKQQEVVLKKRLLPSASQYTVRVRVQVTNDADDWNGARCVVYGKNNQGRGNEEIQYNADIKKYIDESDEVFDSGTRSCGNYFPTKVNIYTDFGSYGVGPRDFEADVKIWINDILVKTHHINLSCFGRTRTKGVADNWISVPSNKYPYPEDIEVTQKREIDLLDLDNTSTVSITAVDQYGVKFKGNGANSYSMENRSFPNEDIYTCLDTSGGLKWKFDTKRLNDCHNSKYRLGFKSGGDYKPWSYIDIIVRFRVPLYLTVKVGNSTDGYTELDKIAGRQNETVDVTMPEIKTGYRLDLVKKGSGTGVVITNKDGTYSFKLQTTNSEFIFQTTPIKYKIEYDRNASSKKVIGGSMSTKQYSYGSPVVLERNVYKSLDKEKYPYEFAGWNTEKDGSGTAYEDAAVVKNLTTVHGEKITLYAQWRDATTGSIVTASLFSHGMTAIWTGLAVTAVMALVLGCVVSIRKR